MAEPDQDLIQRPSAEEQQRLELRKAYALLEEVLDYLERLPVVPATRELCVKVREQMEAPAMRQAVRVQEALHGLGPTTSAGLPIFEATVFPDNTLRAGLPEALHGAARREALRELEALLANGRSVALQLHPKRFGR